NNKQAPGWAAADDKFDFGPVFRSQMIEARVKKGISGGHRMTLQGLVQAMDEPATQDLRAVALMPILRRVLGRPRDADLRGALDLLSRWAAAGAHRRDMNRDGHDEDAAAITLMDAWWPRLVKAEFGGIGTTAFDRLSAVLRPDDVLPEDLPEAPDYDDGWWGFVSKDLRDLVARRSVRGRWSRVYCGGGSLASCRAALLSSLSAATKVSAASLYGKGDCKSNPDPACSDQNRPTVASAVTMPPFPFQNRPTFQQTVEITTGPATPAAPVPRKRSRQPARQRTHRRTSPNFTG
ncbi:MAG TPA: penicillin acylase family protein, partial [Thermoleophilaceae bacterium]|nr:penicillin acylase family protein [Thermoleophilaceae bacterium]